MTHHHSHARKHIRLNADAWRMENSGNDVQSAHHHHHQHSDVHSQPETNTSDEPVADDEAAPIAHHDINRRNGEVVQTVTTYVATEYDLLIESGTSTLGKFTVSTLPAVVTVPNFGALTVPANAGPLVTGALPSSLPPPVETNAATAAPATGATAMAGSPNHQVPLVSSKTTFSISETSQPSATQSVASDTSSASSDVETAVATTAAAAAPMSSASTTSGVSTSSISNSNPTSTSTSTSTSISDSNTISAMTSTSGASATTSSDASASTLLSTTDPASSVSTFSSTSTLSAGPTASNYGATEVSATSSSSSSSSSSSTSTTSAASSGSSGGVNETPKIVGGVLGGVLGTLFLLVLAFLLLRWKRRRATAAGVERTFGRDGVLGGDTQSFKPRAPEMSSWRRSSNTPLATGAFFNRRQPSSPGYSDDSPTGERGFQKISGRKIQSVLHTGGDGYGDEIEEEPIPDNPFESSSPISPTSAHSDYHQGPLVRLDSGDGAMMRPSPARTATMSSSADLMASSPPWQLGVAPLRPDPVGRSLPRQDGSRNSRFTERI
ncbi:hypothetical protein PISL3812_02892 [Talaromyces islandicus]|uniref:Mid2 domain-containing protein n=1 Tax=Talaromyces islandicus TaxID=28573 RepID=A0A0U1LR58_TALIS|nr:hypothetical protein PISL3812_02892 [Talaromyces islandicus]